MEIQNTQKNDRVDINEKVDLARLEIHAVDTKIFEYQILEYVNRITTTKNGVKAAYSLAWGKYS